MGYSGAGGKLIDEKTQKRKISWHCPFNAILRNLDVNKNFLSIHHIIVLCRNHLRWHQIEEETRLKEKLEERGTEQEVFFIIRY